MARRKREPKKKSVALIYRKDGETIRYIDMPADQLPVELNRLVGVMLKAKSLLDRVKRVKHPLIEYVRFQADTVAKTVSPDVTAGLSEAQMVEEIGRLNHVLSDSLHTLERFKTPFPTFKEAAFRLQYGQTSRKREAGWNSFKRDRDDESVPDPEEGEDSSEF